MIIIVVVINVKPTKAQLRVPPFSQAQTRSQVYKSSRAVSAGGRKKKKKSQPLKEVLLHALEFQN